MSGKTDAARQAFGEGTLSWTRDRLFAQLLTAEYQYSDAHTSATQLTGRLGAPVELTGKTIARGHARCATIVFGKIKGDQPAVAYAIYRDRPNAQLLVAYIDAITGFPMMPNGGDIVVDPPDPSEERLAGAGIFRI